MAFFTLQAVAVLVVVFVSPTVRSATDCTNLVKSTSCNSDTVQISMNDNSAFAKSTWNPKSTSQAYPVTITTNYNSTRNVSCCSTVIIDNRDSTFELNFDSCDAIAMDNGDYEIDLKVVNRYNSAQCPFSVTCSPVTSTPAVGTTTSPSGGGSSSAPPKTTSQGGTTTPSGGGSTSSTPEPATTTTSSGGGSTTSKGAPSTPEGKTTPEPTTEGPTTSSENPTTPSKKTTASPGTPTPTPEKPTTTPEAPTTTTTTTEAPTTTPATTTTTTTTTTTPTTTGPCTQTDSEATCISLKNAGFCISEPAKMRLQCGRVCFGCNIPTTTTTTTTTTLPEPSDCSAAKCKSEPGLYNCQNCFVTCKDVPCVDNNGAYGGGNACESLHKVYPCSAIGTYCARTCGLCGDCSKSTTTLNNYLMQFVKR